MNNILLAVTACWQYSYPKWVGHPLHRKTDHRMEAMLATWWPEIAKVEGVKGKFFYGRPLGCIDPHPDTIVLTDVADDYDHLKNKVHAICEWFLANDFDLLVKLDDDTAVDVPALASLIRALRDHYMGQVVGNYCYGGAGYVLSRYAARFITRKEVPTGGKASRLSEDLWVGSILRDAGVWPHHVAQFNQQNGITLHCRQEGQMLEWWKQKQLATLKGETHGKN